MAAAEAEAHAIAHMCTSARPGFSEWFDAGWVPICEAKDLTEQGWLVASDMHKSAHLGMGVPGSQQEAASSLAAPVMPVYAGI